MDAAQIRNLSIACLLVAMPALSRAVVVHDAGELVSAVNDPSVEEIQVSGVIELGRLNASSANALPLLEGGPLSIRGQGEGAELRASGPGYRLMEVHGFVHVYMENLTVSDFSSNLSGGAIHSDNGSLSLKHVTFRNNHSANNGGALTVEGRDAGLEVTDSRFDGNSADGRGGAVHLRNTLYDFDFQGNQFVNNRAPSGCAVSMRAAGGAIFRTNVFRGACDGALVDAVNGRQGFHFTGNTFVAQGRWAFRFRVDPDADQEPNMLTSNVLVQTEPLGYELCHLVGGDASDSPNLESRGYNVATDTSCHLDHDTDAIASSAQEVLANPPNPELAAGGPATDAIPLPVTSNQPDSFICGVKDARGLGRPQDGDGDGVFACDLGALERRRGPDIGPAQTGAYFDPSRPGEGYFVEVLDEGRAVVSMFTYGSGQASMGLQTNTEWYLGVGEVMGNSIVVSQFLHPDLYPVGDDFDPHDVNTSDGGDLSLVFSGCDSSESMPGRAYLRTQNTFNVPFNPTLFDRAVRLTSVVPCGVESQPAPSGRSGNFFDPDLSGQGIEVQWLPDGRVLVIWYTFDNQGFPLWLISDGAMVDGDTVTAPMVYPAHGTAFGDGFDPNEIDLQPWGTVTLHYTDCDHMDFSYDSTVDGFGSGSFDYVRLTQPAGTECDL